VATGQDRRRTSGGTEEEVSNTGAQTNFGQTWSCATDVTMPCVWVTGNTAVAQMLLHRFITPRGGLLSDPNFGLCLIDYLNSPLTSDQLTLLAQQCNAEAVKDERVLSASFVLTFVSGTLTVSGTVQTANGPFQLVLAVGTAVQALIQVTPA
jgi:hypothetical protein